MYKRILISAAVSAACSAAFAAPLEEGVPSLHATTSDKEVEVDLAAATPSTLVVKAPTAVETRVRALQPHLNQVKKPYANQLGTGNGAGVVVGVVDTGIQANHPVLDGQVVASYNAFTGGTDVTDQIGHGTHVAGLIAGSTLKGGLTEGIASGAKLAVAKVFSSTGTSDSITIGKGIDWAVNTAKAPIVNLSLGASTVALQASVQNAVSKGTLVVAALGNDGKKNGASWPAQFAKASWANGQIIAVGAVDANNKRASFSNYDPTLANWTVYAPGVNVVSSYSNTTTKNAYSAMSGTSMATPIVAGQAALIKSNWNFLPAKDIAQVIFQSATRLCSDAVSAATCAARTAPDAQYGWGLVNVEASLQPIGALNVGTKTGSAVTYTGTSLATAKSGLGAGLAKTTVLAVDKFNRGFLVSVAASSTSPASKSAVTPVVAAPVSKVGAVKFSADYTAVQSVQGLNGLSFQDTSPTALGKAYLSLDGASGSSFGMGTGGSASKFFGLDATGGTPLDLTGNGDKFSSPFFQLAESAHHLGYGIPFAGGTVKVGAVSQSQEANKAMLGAAADTGAGNKSLTVAEFQRSFGATTAVVSLGELSENQAMLGASGTGAMTLGGASKTHFVTLAASRQVLPSVSLSGMLSLGRSEDFSNSAASLVDSIQGVTSAAWSLGLARNGVWKTGDALGFTVSMPLRTMTGTASVTSAVSQSQEDGSLSYATQTLALAPSGMEKNLEFSYTRPISRTAQLHTVAQMKLEPGHVAGAATQYGLGLKFTNSF